MTDRIKGYVVTLAKDMREDDAASTTAAIERIKGVMSVEPLVSGIDDHIAYQRARREIAQKLHDTLWSAQEKSDAK